MVKKIICSRSHLILWTILSIHVVQDSWNLRWHLAYRQPEDRVAVGGVCYQKCHLCGIQVSTVGKPSHEASKTCKDKAETRHQHALAAQGRAALQQTFTHLLISNSMLCLFYSSPNSFHTLTIAYASKGEDEIASCKVQCAQLL